MSTVSFSALRNSQCAEVCCFTVTFTITSLQGEQLHTFHASKCKVSISLTCHLQMIMFVGCVVVAILVWLMFGVLT